MPKKRIKTRDFRLFSFVFVAFQHPKKAAPFAPKPAPKAENGEREPLPIVREFWEKGGRSGTGRPLPIVSGKTDFFETKNGKQSMRQATRREGSGNLARHVYTSALLALYQKTPRGGRELGKMTIEKRRKP